jgi:plastocyanin
MDLDSHVFPARAAPAGGEKDGEDMLAPRFALALLATLAPITSAATQPATQPATQRIDVWNFGFAPHPIHLAAGRPVTLAFVNRSGSSHDFTAAAFFASAAITAGAAPNGEIDLPGHATRTVTLVPRAGTYKAHCSHFLHKQMGMDDLIVVN